MSRSTLTQRPHWLITRHKISQLEALTIGSEDDEQALPVFSFEEEAQMFLRFWAGAASGDWKVRETSVGELASMLYGPCEGVSKVALDPLPEVCGGLLLGLLSVERNEFVRVLLEGQFSTAHPIPPWIRRSAHRRPARRKTHVAAGESNLFRL